MNVVIRPSFPPVQMRIVCAWCRIELRNGPEDPVTHGICAHCREQFERACNRLAEDIPS